MNILVTGAAGYIGSIVTEELIKDGHTVIALDNLQQGHRAAVNPEAEFVHADLGNTTGLEDIFCRRRIEAVMHLAAESIVPESMSEPSKFFHNNIVYGLNMLDIMSKNGVDKIIFSSSAAVYGEPEEVPIREIAHEKPANPYGETKLALERVLHWYSIAYGLKYISLRYFNAAGASEQYGEDHNPETHLIPNVLRVALGQQDYIPLFGTDYPTHDGSCIRDYVHVADIARAHILSLLYLQKGGVSGVFNLGNSKGFSVREVIATARGITGHQIPLKNMPRRRGDPAVLVADATRTRSVLGWQPRLSDLENIIASAWRWQREHPHGYRENPR